MLREHVLQKSTRLQKLKQFIATYVQNGEATRLIRFLLVGLTGTSLDFVLLTVLKRWGGWPTLVANTFSYSAGIINNFTINRMWTFADSTNPKILSQFTQYFTINFTGLLFNNFLIWLLEPACAFVIADDLAYLPAKAIASFVSVLLNFTANRYLTFRDIKIKHSSNNNSSVETELDAS